MSDNGSETGRPPNERSHQIHEWSKTLGVSPDDLLRVLANRPFRPHGISTAAKLRWFGSLLWGLSSVVVGLVACCWWLGQVRPAIGVFMGGCGLSIPILMWRASLLRLMEQRRKPVLTEYSLRPWTPRPLGVVNSEGDSRQV